MFLTEAAAESNQSRTYFIFHPASYRCKSKKISQMSGLRRSTATRVKDSRPEEVRLSITDPSGATSTEKHAEIGPRGAAPLSAPLRPTVTPHRLAAALRCSHGR